MPRKTRRSRYPKPVRHAGYLLVGIAAYGGHILGALFQAPFWMLTAREGAELVEGGRQKLLVRDPHRLLLIADGLAQGHL